MTGEKAFVPIAGRAKTILVYAAGEDASTEAFLVASDNPGLKVGEKENWWNIWMRDAKINDTRRAPIR